MADRVCSECGASLAGKSPSAKTCSERCRATRSRRRRGEVKQAVGRELTGPDDFGGTSAIQKAISQELVPIVRDAIDDQVVEAIGKLLALTPAAVKAVEEDLNSADAVLRQRAYSLVVKYTVGHPALVKPTSDEAPDFNVYIGLPRPEDAAVEATAIEDVVEETKICDVCGQEKLASEFASNSDRCRACFELQKTKILAEFGL